MRTMPVVAVTFAALSFNSIGARADGTWCAFTGRGSIAVSTHSSSAAQACQGAANFANAIHYQSMPPNREGAIGATIRKISAEAEMKIATPQPGQVEEFIPLAPLASVIRAGLGNLNRAISGVSA